MMLDIQSVRLFVLAVDLGNLTRVAEAAGTVQPAVSQRLKALEAQLGRRLLERSPRFVRTTADGGAFLVHARALLAAHDAALAFASEPAVRFSIGASEHALGVRLEEALRLVRASLPPNAAIAVRMGRSQAIRAAFDEGEFDAAIIRREGGGGDGEVIGTDPLGWRGGAQSAPSGDAVRSPAWGRRAACARSRFARSIAPGDRGAKRSRAAAAPCCWRG
jgi:DNA-binding transcriptional LysR family regulator